MQRKTLLLLGMLLMGFVFLSKVSIAYAVTGNYNVDSSYYFIQFNGAQQEIIVNDNIALTLTGWTDESKTTVNGTIHTVSTNITEDVTFDVNNELNELTVTTNESIHYRIAVSDSFKAEIVEPLELNDRITVVAENANGTSIEKVGAIDEYDTVVENKGLTYYKTDANNQKVVITQEEYNALNSAVSGETSFSAQAVAPSVRYASHVEYIGWQNAVSDGAMSGTQGQAKQLEAMQISIENAPYSGGISYKTHVQDYGWLTSASDGETSGTTGQAKQVEAIQVNLTGEMANHYDVYYRVHSAFYGWLGWAKNGASAGTEGLAKQSEAIEIVLVEKGGAAPGSTDKPIITAPSLAYSTHVETYGWLDFVANGATGGTVGQAKRLEAMKIDLQDAPYSGDVIYTTHVQEYGWLTSVSDGVTSGTTGEGKQVEAIQVNLTGEMANHYDVYYRVHSELYGWLGWAKNGASAGTQGLAKQLEAIEIVLVKKGRTAPGSTDKPFITGPSLAYSTHVETYGWLNFVANGATGGTVGQGKRLEAIKIDLQDAPYSGNITYSTHVQEYGWMASVSEGEMSGTTWQGKRVEAIQVNLTGEMANHYDVYYRVHSQDFGWLGWAKNGMKAGSQGLEKQAEAIEIKLVRKGQGEPVNANVAFKLPLKVFLDPGHGGSDPGAVAGGYRESDFNLAVAKKVQSLLVQRGYTVYMSRNNDTTVSLLDRPQMANNLNADIFVSIHTNSSGTTTVNGIESYYYEYNPSYPSKINQDMHNNPERIAKSVTLANIINDKMVGYTGANNRGTDGDTFAVIREAAMPATLLEMGFISNSSERQKLASDSYQNTLARAIADGIDQYFQIY
ncbi:N-acetylmuramoyl-L-alanine amidase [Bacillus canaveralius]|nr:N-acetylmuramoyl-L-alanine amidase [Bacillus canaveralius]